MAESARPSITPLTHQDIDNARQWAESLLDVYDECRRISKNAFPALDYDTDLSGILALDQVIEYAEQVGHLLSTSPISPAADSALCLARMREGWGPVRLSSGESFESAHRAASYIGVMLWSYHGMSAEMKCERLFRSGEIAQRVVELRGWEEDEVALIRMGVLAEAGAAAERIPVGGPVPPLTTSESEMLQTVAKQKGRILNHHAAIKAGQPIDTAKKALTALVKRGLISNVRRRGYSITPAGLALIPTSAV